MGFHRVQRKPQSMKQMATNRSTEITSETGAKDVCRAIVDWLGGGRGKARFMTELYAALKRSQIDPAQTDHALAELEARGEVMIRDHFCADPHLAGVDLRVVALVESSEGADRQMSAIRVIDEAWNKWLSEYLANHRCG
jgi:hypothetical protein